MNAHAVQELASFTVAKETSIGGIKEASMRVAAISKDSQNNSLLVLQEYGREGEQSDCVI